MTFYRHFRYRGVPKLCGGLMFAKRFAALAVGISISFSALASPVQWTSGSGGNDHWYELVTNTTSGWQSAMDLAGASEHLGMTGYLLTVTSAMEQAIITSLAAGHVLYLAGSDAGNEGFWTWRAGPEIGQAFTYANWAVGEPNNGLGFGAENALMMWEDGSWNDAGAFDQRAYIVEFSAAPSTIPVPATIALFGLGFFGVAWRRRNKS